jgi:hypothetical protein
VVYRFHGASLRGRRAITPARHADKNGTAPPCRGRRRTAGASRSRQLATTARKSRRSGASSWPGMPC